MLEKIYLVRYGCYSGQGIAGAFSTEEKAQRYCEIHNELDSELWMDKHWVDEYIVDLYQVPDNTKVVTYYIARIGLKDTRLYKKGVLNQYMDEYKEKDVYTRDVEVNFKDDYIEVKSIHSNKHAQKVAIEQYQKYTQQELENGKV